MRISANDEIDLPRDVHAAKMCVAGLMADEIETAANHVKANVAQW